MLNALDLKASLIYSYYLQWATMNGPSSVAIQQGFENSPKEKQLIKCVLIVSSIDVRMKNPIRRTEQQQLK